jgi:hypothetical protein
MEAGLRPGTGPKHNSTQSRILSLAAARAAIDHSHSIVAGGLLLTS